MGFSRDVTTARISVLLAGLTDQWGGILAIPALGRSVPKGGIVLVVALRENA